MDPAMYSDWAIQIAQGDIIGKEVFHAMPLYTYFLGFLYFLTNFSIYSARLFQFMLGSLSVILIYFLAKEIFDIKTAVMSSLIACFYAPFMFYEGMFVPSSLVVFLFVLAALALFLIKDDTKPKTWFLYGILIGISALANASILLFLICLPIFKKDLKSLVSFYLAVAAIIGIVAARNYIVGKDAVFITSHGGVNFYIGNNESATGHFSSIGYSVEGATNLIEDTKILAEKGARSPLKPSQISAYWTKKALGFITRHPIKYSGLVLKKIYIFWSGFEYPDVEDYYLAKKFTPILRLPLFAFWFVAPLGLCGIFLSLKYWRKVAVLYAFLLLSMVGTVIMFVNSRYRMTAMPFVIIFSGFAISYFWNIIKEKKFKSAILFMLIFIVAFLFVNLGAQKPDYAMAYYNLSALYLNRGEYDNAINSARESLEIFPETVLPRHILGMAYFYKGDSNEAIRQLNAALEIRPDFAQGYAFLGEIYFSKKDYKKAKIYFEKAVLYDPNDFDSRAKLDKIKEK